MSIENHSENGLTPELQSEKFIIPEGKYFDETKNSLLLGISNEQVDLSGVQELADKNAFDLKKEFHITVLGFKNGAEIKKVLKSLPEEERLKAISQIRELIEKTDWQIAFEPQKYHIAKEYVSPDPKGGGAEIKERRESYIQMVNLPSMEAFYNQLNAILGTQLKAPPAHITLYTAGDNREKAKMGIGINTEEEFLKMSPELI